MRITSSLFQAFLQCPTKCFLLSRGEVGTGNPYAEWVRSQNECCRNDGVERLVASANCSEGVICSPTSDGLTPAQWKLAVNLTAQWEHLESDIHAVEQVPPKGSGTKGRGRPGPLVPTRFLFSNKLTRADKLLLGYDALVLSRMLDCDVGLGKIIHGDNHKTMNVRTSILANNVRKLAGSITDLLSSSSPPDLVLNRHCPECEFQLWCRGKAVETDDLSLLAGMTEAQRKVLNSKGLFTITQLSYTFRPRRRSKRLAAKPEKYHHSLKASDRRNASLSRCRGAS